MIYGIYSIRDVKTGFLPPTVDVNDDSAIRNFHFAFTKTNSLFIAFPNDYSLYKLAEYDTESGSVSPCDVPVWLSDAPEVKNE